MKYFCVLLVALYFPSVHAQRLVLATYQYADNNRLDNIKPLSKYLADSLGFEIEIKSYPTVHLFIEGIKKNEVDIALINTFGYLLLETAINKYEMKPYAVLKVKEGTHDNYKTAILARKSISVSNIKDLYPVASKYRLGLVSIGSTSGNLMPRLKLSSIGIESPESVFKSVEYCNNHKNTIDLLVDGKIDICAVGSTEYFKVLADKNKADSVRLLWLSSEIPLGPVLLHDRLSESTKLKVLSLLLSLDKVNVESLESVKLGWSEAKQAEKYIKIDGSYYDQFKDQFGNKEAMQRILIQFAN